MTNICPRTGQPCDKPKVFGVTQITPQGLQQMQCCQACLTNTPGMTALPVLPNLQQILQKIKTQSGQVQPSQQQHILPTCPACGVNPIQIEQMGRFGCPQCYETFKEDIEGMLMRHHGAIKHVGKVPKAWKARRDAEMSSPTHHKDSVDRTLATVKRHKQIPLEDRMKVLELKMAECVKKEEYERAALIRDVLKQMKASVAPPASEPPLENPLTA